LFLAFSAIRHRDVKPLFHGAAYFLIRSAPCSRRAFSDLEELDHETCDAANNRHIFVCGYSVSSGKRWEYAARKERRSKAKPWHEEFR
jgi:hypothetical protein